MKVWLTKHTLTRGIIETEARICDIPGMISYTFSFVSFTQYAHGEGKEWHRTLEGAREYAKEMRNKKVAALKRPENIGIQSTNNKQGRQASDLDRTADLEKYDAHCRAAFKLYRELLANDWPRELARGVLPLCTYSHMFATVNLLNLMKFFTLRSDPHAQMEIRVYADAMRELISTIVPTCIDAWEETNGKS